MKVDMVMPQMGESIAEATIAKWRKQPGEPIQKDEIILEISTDKVDSEIPAPASGTLVEVLFKEGDVVPVKTKIATIDTDGKGAVAPAKESKSEKAGVPPKAKEEPRQTANGSFNGGAHHGNSGEEHADEGDSDKFFSPLVKNLAAKHGVPLAELHSIPGSGLGGRVNKQDLLSYVETRQGRPAGKPASPSTPASPSSSAPRPSQAKPSSDMPSIDWAEDGTKVVVMDNMRQAIAEHMVRSKHTSPHVYSVQEVDMTNVSKYREAHKKSFKEREGFSLSFTPFFLEAAVKALVHFPQVNASVDGKKIILKRNVNLGCAVALGDPRSGGGLIVPVIKRSEEKNLLGLSRGLNDLANRARTKKLLPDDVMGGTFTVTNPGVFGTVIGNPIINQPQVAILCLGAIKKRPVVIDDMIAIREICYLTLSYDHRIVDGMLGGQFLAFIREYLENWDMERSIW